MRLSEGLFGSQMTLPALQRVYIRLSEGPMRLSEGPMRLSEDPASPQRALSGCQKALSGSQRALPLYQTLLPYQAFKEANSSRTIRLSDGSTSPPVGPIRLSEVPIRLRALHSSARYDSMRLSEGPYHSSRRPIRARCLLIAW